MPPTPVDSGLVAAPHPFGATLTRDRARVRSIATPRVLVVALTVSLALVTRLWGLGAVSFSEDEINKLNAARAYDRGDFSVNAEHPMLMKLAVWGSLHAAGHAMPPEAALRLPNALAGAAATVVVFLLGEALFDTSVGAWSSLIWATDINAAAINRIGKEDTLLVLFLLAAAYLYERGKALTHVDRRQRDRWYVGSAAAFGLMLASKYMPHYFGLHTVYNFAADDDPADKTPDKRWPFFATMALVFIVANIALVQPSTWAYLAGYARGDALRHTGYRFAHRLYLNTLEVTPWGLPWTFYATFFATKVPIVVLAAAVGGSVWSARHATHRGATFIRVFLVLTLLPYSLAASKFLRYMLPVIAVVDIAAGVGVAWAVRTVERRRGGGWTAALVSASALCIVIGSATQVWAVGPYYGLAQNAIGARIAPAGSLFPDDELYDTGVREAVSAIARAAASGAVVCSDAPAVVSEYLAATGRTDMTSCSLSHDGLPMRAIETWVIVQEAHIYFESEPTIQMLRRRQRPWLDVRLAGVSAAEVYRWR